MTWDIPIVEHDCWRLQRRCGHQNIQNVSRTMNLDMESIFLILVLWEEGLIKDSRVIQKDIIKSLPTADISYNESHDDAQDEY